MYRAVTITLGVMGLVGRGPGICKPGAGTTRNFNGYLEFGEHQKGDPAEKTVTLSNSGDVPLGIDSISLAADENAARATGAYKLSWNCENVEAPSTSDDEEDADPSPAPDTGSDPETGEEPETGDIDTGDTNTNPPVGNLRVSFRKIYFQFASNSWLSMRGITGTP